MKIEKNQQRVTAGRKAQGKDVERTQTSGGKDGDEECVEVGMWSLLNDQRITFTGEISLDRKLFKGALEAHLTGYSRNIDSLVRDLPKDDGGWDRGRKVLGCLTGDPFLEIEISAMKKRRDSQNGRTESTENSASKIADKVLEKGLRTGVVVEVDNHDVEIEDTPHTVETPSVEIGEHDLNNMEEFNLLSILSDNEVFMKDYPDHHFTIKPLHDFYHLEPKPCYRQLYSFRFPKLGLVQLSCQLFYIIYVGDSGNLRRFVRASIQGEAEALQGKPLIQWWLLHSDVLHGPWHPLEKILDLFVFIDHQANRPQLIASVQHLQDIEHRMQDDATPEVLRDTTVSLVVLNTNLSKLRTSLHYLQTSLAVMKRNTPELEAPRHRDLLLQHLPSQPAEYWPLKVWKYLTSPARGDRRELREQLLKEFEKADWYHPASKTVLRILKWF